MKVMKKMYLKPVVVGLSLATDSSMLAGSGVEIGDMTNHNNDGSSTSSGGFGTDTPIFDNQGGGFSSNPAKKSLWDSDEEMTY